MEFLLGFIFLLIICAVLISAVILILKGERNRPNQIYLGCQCTVILWCLSQVLILLSSSDAEFAFSIIIANLGICFIGSSWLAFAIAYVNQNVKPILKYLPFGISLFHFLVVLTNPIHHLYYKVLHRDSIIHGPFFISNVCFTYLFVILGAIILYRNLDPEQLRGGGKGFIIASVMAPLSLNALQLLGFVHSSFDITPLGFGISIICLFLAILKFDFLDLNRELMITNEKLLLANERNRIAQEVHDTSGHTLTMIASYLRLAQIESGKGNYSEVKEHLDGAINLTNTGLKELRESINRLRQEEQYELVTQGVMHLSSLVHEIPVDVTIQGEDHTSYSHLSRIIYECVRESITNCLKHANASRMEIILRFTPDSIEVIISDDGIGCSNIIENNGIRGIRERIEQYGGTVKWISGDGEGFVTRIHLNVHKK